MPQDWKDWLWRLDCLERRLEELPALADLRLSGHLDYGAMIPEDRRTFSIWGKYLHKFPYGRLAVRAQHTVVPRLKDGVGRRLLVGFEICGKPFLFVDNAICHNIKDHPQYCDAQTDDVCVWETWYYLESTRGREGRYWEPQELEVLESFEEAVWACVAQQAAVFGITNSWQFLWGGSLIVLAMMKAHPLLQLHISDASNPDDPPSNFYDLVPDYVSATRYAFEVFRRLAQGTASPNDAPAASAVSQPNLADLRNAQADPTLPGETGSAQEATKEQPWADDAPEYLPLTEARKLIDGRLSLPTLSKLLRPDCEIRYMRKRGEGCKVHVADFRMYMQGRQSDTTFATALAAYFSAAGKGDVRFFWRCSQCGADYPENSSATTNCPKCKVECKLLRKDAPKPRR